MNRFLITGGCGFIGTSLVAELINTRPDSQIFIVDNLVTGSKSDLSEVCTFKQISHIEINDNVEAGIYLIVSDIRDFETMMFCSKNIDCIVHLAANTGVLPSVEDPRLDMECNVIGTFNMLEAARKNSVKKFIFASSGAPAGEVEPPIHEEIPCHPVSPYGSSKLAGEGYCSSYHRTFGIDTVALRFGNVFGPRSKNKSSVVAKFIRQAINDQSCTIYGDGSQTRDFIYISDLIKAIILSIDQKIGGEIFQIATGKERTVAEVAEAVAESLHERGISMRILFESPRKGDVIRNYSDTGKAQKILGWIDNTPFHQGIRATVDYFLKMKYEAQS